MTPFTKPKTTHDTFARKRARSARRRATNDRESGTASVRGIVTQATTGASRPKQAAIAQIVPEKKYGNSQPADIRRPRDRQKEQGGD